MKNFNELRKAILADGKIDEHDVMQLKKLIYEDGKIDKEEAEFIFELNDAVSGNDNHDSWTELFVSAMSDFLLKDVNSPGVVDESEANWLLEMIQNDNSLDQTELALIQNLKEKAKQLPLSLLNC